MRILKKVFLFILCVVSLLFMFGCEKEKGKEKEAQLTKSSGEKNILTGASGDDEEINKDVKYVIKKKSIITKNINANYPQISNLDNQEIELKWNQIIENKVESELNNIGSKDSYFLSYDVKTQNNDMISILIIGEMKCSSNDYETRIFKYSYNIDLATGNGIRLKNRINTEKVAKNLLAGKKYSLKTIEESQFREYMNLFYSDKKELVDYLNEFDFGENFSYVSGYSYYENGKIYLCMSVNHQLGDYIEILIDN